MSEQPRTPQIEQTDEQAQNPGISEYVEMMEWAIEHY